MHPTPYSAAARRPFKIVRTVAELRQTVRGWKEQGLSVAFVPTMGALHAGHGHLVQRAVAAYDRTVVSIFVNPAQFDRPDDLEKYPRGEDTDAHKLVEFGADILYAPAVSEIYPDGFTTKVQVPSLTDCLCGATRAGHFDGVALVVTKLLLQCAPHSVFFGEKDWQQLQVVRRLVTDLDIPVEIHGIPIVRENLGLALSSRNQRLTDLEQAIAPTLYKVMGELTEKLQYPLVGTTIADMLQIARTHLAKAGFGTVDYLELRTGRNLELVETAPVPFDARLFAAVFLGSVRLIDNVPVWPEGTGVS